MFDFKKSWTDEIAEASTDPEFQNATVRLVDPSIVTVTKNHQSGTITEDASAAELYTGQARIVGVRWGVNRENNDTGNSSTLTSVTVQFPKKALGRIKRACKMTVTACPDNPALTTYMFSLTSDFQGSNAAARTLEFAVDGDLVVT